MSNAKLIIISALIVLVLAGIPHLLAYNTDSHLTDEDLEELYYQSLEEQYDEYGQDETYIY